MDQIDWATECPNTWLNMIFGVSVMVFPNEIRLTDALSE